MASPTVRASNVWQVDAQDDILQISAGRGGIVLGGIDSTGAGFGALAGGGTPGGVNSQLQYNNNGVFGGIAESDYVVGTGLTLGAANFSVAFVGGPTGNNAIGVGSTGVEIDALESGATFQVNTDSDITISSANGVLNFAGQSGSFAATGEMQFTSTAGSVVFVSGAAVPTYSFANIPVFANNAAAITGGLSAGDLYRTGANPDVVCTVH